MTGRERRETKRLLLFTGVVVSGWSKERGKREYKRRRLGTPASGFQQQPLALP